MKRNPWLQLPPLKPFVLDGAGGKSEVAGLCDSDPVHAIQCQLLPEPFVGNPFQARVVLLSLNPGYQRADKKFCKCNVRSDDHWHLRPDFREAARANLSHKSDMAYPFYLLDPIFKLSPGGRYWRMRLRRLAGLEHWFEDSALWQKLASRICVIEWFPYHSERASFPADFHCSSQGYSFQLVKELLRCETPIIVMRSWDRWCKAVQDLVGKSEVIRSKHAQGGWLSEKTLGLKEYEKVRSALDLAK